MNLRRNHWTAIPNFLIEMELDPKAFKLYCAYLRNQDYHEAKDDKPYASDEHMVKLCGLNIRTLQRAKKILKDLNLIEISYSEDNVSIIFCNTDLPNLATTDMAKPATTDMAKPASPNLAENIILKVTNTENNNTENSTTKNFEKIEKQAKERNKKIEELEKSIRSKKNDLEMAPNLAIRKELEAQIKTEQLKLKKIDPKLIQEELEKKVCKNYVKIPSIVYYFKILKNFQDLSKKAQDVKDLKFINAVYACKEMTQKQIDYFINIINKIYGVEMIKGIEDSITEEDAKKLEKGEF